MKRLITPKKIKKLAEKALKDKPTWKPTKNHKYLEQLNPGAIFQVGTIKGILLECHTNAKVIIIESESITLGKTIISAKTEVIEL
tara:strand:- start:1682 stop:1936 length:255 start_codon:yes stop_codon:yes gene_type:complete